MNGSGERRSDERGSEGFGRSLRLRRPPEFDRVQRTGVRYHGRFLVVLRAASVGSGPRFGLAVSRKVGNAVVRNQVKRRIREVVRRRAAALDAWDVVVIARPAAAGATLEDFAGELDAALRPITAGAR